jgi:hypothetical protein
VAPVPEEPAAPWGAYRLEVLRLAATQYPGSSPAGVLDAADAFFTWLARPVSLVLDGPVITMQENPAHVLPTKRSGASMAVTMNDIDQAAYAVSETDSRGAPVTGDAITWTESSGGAVVTTDGTSGVFVAVAPGTVTITATDGTLTASDTINVTASGAAALVLGTPTVTASPAAAPTA